MDKETKNSVEVRAETVSPVIRDDKVGAVIAGSGSSDNPESVAIATASRLPVIDKMEKAFIEVKEREAYFKKQILDYLQLGRDYGFPPGCEARLDKDGNIIQTIRGRQVVVPKSQWQAKPSLYQAGACRIRDLFGFLGYPTKANYERSQAGDVCKSTCTLVHAEIGEKIGEGAGAFKVGTKGMDVNGAMQMADKRAFVAAVRRNFPCCADLFTQDREDADGRDQLPRLAEQPNADHSEFDQMFQEWVDESIDPASPIANHQATAQEIKAARTRLSVWCSQNMPSSAEEAVKWLKENCRIIEDEGLDGDVIGINVEKIS